MKPGGTLTFDLTAPMQRMEPPTAAESHLMTAECFMRGVKILAAAELTEYRSLALVAG